MKFSFIWICPGEVRRFPDQKTWNIIFTKVTFFHFESIINNPDLKLRQQYKDRQNCLNNLLIYKNKHIHLLSRLWLSLTTHTVHDAFLQIVTLPPTSGYSHQNVKTVFFFLLRVWKLEWQQTYDVKIIKHQMIYMIYE